MNRGDVVEICGDHALCGQVGIVDAIQDESFAFVYLKDRGDDGIRRMRIRQSNLEVKDGRVGIDFDRGGLSGAAGRGDLRTMSREKTIQDLCVQGRDEDSVLQITGPLEVLARTIGVEADQEEVADWYFSHFEGGDAKFVSITGEDGQCYMRGVASMNPSPSSGVVKTMVRIGFVMGAIFALVMYFAISALL